MQNLSTVESRVANLERDLAALRKDLADVNEDVYHLVPRTLLLSDSLLLRSLAVWGHYLLGQLLVTIPIAFLVALFLFLTVRMR